MIQNLSQFKKWAAPGKKIHFIENTINPHLAGVIREIAHVQTNALTTLRDDGKKSWLEYPKAKQLLFHEDGTIDFHSPNGDKWLKIRPVL